MDRSAEAVAIVGMAGLYPKAPDIDAFWANILNRVDAVTDSPADWLGNNWLYDPDTTDMHKIYTRKGGFLHDLSRFDPRAHGTVPLSVAGSQPDQMIALKLAHDALRDAGLEPGKFDGSRTGVYLGLAVHGHRANTNGIQQYWMEPQVRELLKALFPGIEAGRIDSALGLLRANFPEITPDSMPGLIPNILTGRIANRLDLMGPNMILDAACASSLISVELAMKELRNGNADIMLAGGINSSTSPLVYGVFCSVNALSRKGLIRPFGREASGTVLGEGAGIVVLKRLSDALRADDRIYAVIRSVGTSSDGKSSGLMAPRVEGAALAIRRAYDGSGIDPATIGLIEAHGTGIPLGERMEIDALRSAFGARNRPVPTIPIGSIKSMIGHCIPAAGSASIIKTALALQNRIIPPTLAGEVNDGIGLDSTPFFVAEEARPWIQSASGPRRAAINAFGFGGINAHMVLEESPVGRTPDPTAAFIRPLPRPGAESRIFAFAADSQAGVLAALTSFAVPGDDGLAQAAAELFDNAGGDCRLAIVAATAEELGQRIATAIRLLSRPDPGSVQTRNGIYFEPSPIDGKTVFLFPGEMGQYTGMLKEGALAIPGIGEWFSDISALTEDRRAFRLQDVIYPPDNSLSEEARQTLDALIHQVDYGSEMVFAADQAICDTLKALGIRADAMLGHSTGENAALIASGRIDLDRRGVCDLIDRMNVVFDSVAKSGSVPSGVLLTVAAFPRASLEEIRAEFPDVQFTMDNCPNQAILFGDVADMNALQERLVARGAICTRLPISWGYHTEFVRPMAEGFRELFETHRLSASGVNVYSCVTARPFPEERDAAAETAVAQYVSRVRFTEAIENLYEDGYRIFIECGPGSNLTAFVRDILGDRPYLAEAADSKRRGVLTQLAHLVARLFVAGRDVDARPFLAPADSPDVQRRKKATKAHMAAPALASELAFWRIDEAVAEKVRSTLFGDAVANAPVTAATAEVQHAAARPEGMNGHDLHLGIGAQGSGYDGVARTVFSTHPAEAFPEMPSQAHRIQMLDLGHVFQLPFNFSGYLMRGNPSYSGMEAYLSQSERQEGRLLYERGKARWQEWSLSRLAVKRAVSDLMSSEDPNPPAWDAIDILKDARGWPYIQPAHVAAAPQISIAHAGGHGLGLAASPGICVGVDYDLPERVSDAGRFMECILSDGEIRRLAPAAETDTAVALWSLKEAAAKSLGVGLQGRPQQFVIAELDDASGFAVITHGEFRLAAQVRRVGAGFCAVAYRMVA